MANIPEFKWINPDDFLETPNGRCWTAERNKVAWKESFALLEKTLADRHRFDRRLYVVCGIQGAGKSTWIQRNAKDLAPCVFFDAALPRAVHRAPLVAIARAANVDAYAVWLNISLEKALLRNARREESVRVPVESIAAVASQFESPSVAEGFRQVSILDQD